MRIKKTLMEIFPNWKNNGGIFYSMRDAPISKIWGVEKLNTLDIEYIGNHSGEKIISPLCNSLLTFDTLTENDITVLSKILLVKYEEKWKKLYNTLIIEYNPISNYDMTEEQTETHSGDITTHNQNVNNTDSTNQMYGYNSNVATDSDKNIINISGTTEQTQTDERSITHTLTRSGNIGVTTTQQMLESERALLLWDYWNVVYKDVDKVLTLGIY